MKSKPVFVNIAAVLLWIVSVLLGLAAIYYLYELVMTLYLSMDNDRSLAGVLRWVALFIGGIAWIGAVLAGGEYHAKHAGERTSWNLFAWTIGIEAVIVLLGLLFA